MTQLSDETLDEMMFVELKISLEKWIIIIETK